LPSNDSPVWFDILKTQRCDLCRGENFEETPKHERYTHHCKDCGFGSEHHKRPLTANQQKYYDKKMGASKTPSKKMRNRKKREARRAKRRNKK